MTKDGESRILSKGFKTLLNQKPVVVEPVETAENQPLACADLVFLSRTAGEGGAAIGKNLAVFPISSPWGKTGGLDLHLPGSVSPPGGKALPQLFPRPVRGVALA